MRSITLRSWRTLPGQAQAWSAASASDENGRLGKPEDIAMAAVYLGASESGFVTGSELVVDGGWLAR